MPQGLPLLPTRSGTHVEKAAVVETLEATVQGYGEEIVGSNGGRLYGGHSFRVAGAQRLASLGVDVIKIMVMARWAGETILRYVKEAPLDSLPDEVLALEGKRNLVHLINKFADGAESLSGRMEGLEAQLQKIIAEKEALVACSHHCIIRHRSSSKVAAAQ